jgi:SulP family sulfate permease
VDHRRILGSKFDWVPALRWIPTYTTSQFGPDLIAGLSLAAFVIPESLAYATLAQLPPVTGLYCYLVAGIAYALFGTSRQLAVGPTSALAIVIATSAAGAANIATGITAFRSRVECRRPRSMTWAVQPRRWPWS